MAFFTHRDYERLEHSISVGNRIAVSRRGTEFVVVPTSLSFVGGREVIHSRHPTTGDVLRLFIDEIDGFEVIG